jgi:hypothetical protein
MHPLIDVLLRQPQLLSMHAKAYGELVLQELSQANLQWHQRLLWQLAGVGSMGVAFALLGVAGMLWSVTPPEFIREPWLLIMLPVAFAGISVGCMTVAHQRYNLAVFPLTRQQFHADMALLGDSESA